MFLPEICSRDLPPVLLAPSGTGSPSPTSLVCCPLSGERQPYREDSLVLCYFAKVGSVLILVISSRASLVSRLLLGTRL